MTPNWNNSTTSSQDGGPSNPRGTNESNNTLQSKEVGYNINKDTQKEGDEMSTDALQDLGDNIRSHATEPILERQSDVHGVIKVYPPATSPDKWGEHSWLLTTEKNADDGSLRGISERIKAKYVHECFDRPHFIFDYHRFGLPDREPIVPVEEKPWNIDVPDRTIKHKDFRFDD